MVVPETSRRERKKDETRQRIFKEAVRLFRERGFEATTIDEITERADVAKGTFFNYFPRKESVLAFLSEKQLSEAEENAGAILAADKPARVKVHEIYALAASAYEEDRELSRYVLLELMTRGFAPAEEAGCRWHDLVARVIRQGQAAGELKGGVSPERAESVLGSVYVATVYRWVCCIDVGLSLRDELRECLDVVLDGLVA